jgi:hypothetical protein
MFHRWAALVLVLALCAMSPKNAAGQTPSSRGHGAKGRVGSNWPNPFNPDTKINFSVDGCSSTTETHVVTIRLVNVLAQPVVFPWLYAGSGTTTVSSALAGQPIQSMALPCGDYIAYWNGKIMNVGREAPSGTYGVEIFIDGTKQPGTPKIFHSK